MKDKKEKIAWWFTTNQSPQPSFFLTFDPHDGDKGYIPHNLHEYMERIIEDKKEIDKLINEITDLIHDNIQKVGRKDAIFSKNTQNSNTK